MTIKHLSTCGALLLTFPLLHGCTVGPNFQAPATEVPADFLGSNEFSKGQANVVRPSPASVARWWASFKDAKLNSLIDRAVSSNLDLRQATSRIRQARASRAVESAAFLPVANVGGSYDRARASGSSSHSRDLYRAGFDASWEIDVFGGIRRSVEAAEAQIDVAIEDRRDLLVTITAEVATAYTDYRGLQRRLVIARENLDAQRKSADLTRRRFNGGFVSGLDVANADAQVATTEAAIPLLESDARQAAYAISILLALPPGALLTELAAESPIPITPPEVPVGLPSDLLRRRPDIRRAEAEIHVATARIGIATADLFPRFSISGAFALSGSNFSSLGNLANRSWSIGPSVSWPIFEGGRIRANIEIQNALQEQFLAAYQQSVLRALQDVEVAMIAYSREQQRRVSLEKAVVANRKAVELSTNLYGQGRTDFLNVLSAQRSLFASEEAIAQSDIRLAQELIALYKALGGGWESELQPTTQPTAS